MRSYYIRVLLRIENITYIYHTLIFMWKLGKFINFYGGGSEDFQKLPPAGSDFALRATQGQSQLLKVLTASPKTLSVENRAKSFLEAYTSTQETLCARRERPAFHAGFQIDFISNFGNSIVRGLSFYSLIWFLYTIFYFIVKMHLISFLIHFIIMLIAVCLFGAYLMGWSRPAHFLFSYKIFMYLCYVKKVFSICIVNI